QFVAREAQEPGREADDETQEDRADCVEDRDPEPPQDQPAIAPQKREIPGVGRRRHYRHAPSPPLGAERVGVRWGIPERSPLATSPPERVALGPPPSPLPGRVRYNGRAQALRSDICRG